MTTYASQSDVEQALQQCADEPIHIPGIIQPFGCLIAANEQNSIIGYASENAAEFVGIPVDKVLGQTLRDVLGKDAWHVIRNGLSRIKDGQKSIDAGTAQIGDGFFDLRIFKSDGNLVVEIEAEQEDALGGSDALKTLTYLMGEIQKAANEQQLFEHTVELMQHLSGYDRVLIYQFDRNYNGQVRAEVIRSGMESYQGLHFPHWDIPAQARAVMGKIPLRFIQDVEQTPVPLLAQSDLPPLDITLATVRGVSSIHMEYLRNMGSAATLTLSVMIEDTLWGVISFHHRRPKVPPAGLRSILISFLSVFEGKLLALRQQDALDRIRSLDQGFVTNSDQETSLADLIPAAAPMILEMTNADGMSALTTDGAFTFGDTPDEDVLEALTELSTENHDTLVIDALEEQFPEKTDSLNQCAGALVVGVLPDRSIALFRNERARAINWAGNPEKTIEFHEGNARLSPRGSFSTFLEQVEGRCEPWSPGEIYLIEHLRTLLQAAERQTMMDMLNRQQALMIGELNHRVRNILALVRSVSRQARRRYGSLDSYANAIENRIRALAAAHDISNGRSTDPVSIYALTQLEFEPFKTITDSQTAISGSDAFIKPEVAPIMSLVFHELTTNAAKYGALLTAAGHVQITFEELEKDLSIVWQETGGPRVNHPNELGFGMAMIEQAIPHELGGTAEVRFEESGLCAEFTIPKKHLVSGRHQVVAKLSRRTPIELEPMPEVPAYLHKGCVIILEDNFIVAKEMADQIRDSGASDIRIFATPDAVFEELDRVVPSLVVLDVNLSNGVTSSGVAARLHELDIPFLFVTGYGDELELDEMFSDAPRLLKPITVSEFNHAVAKLKPSGAN
ncbi:HWE histidine kinase domain-containing protein [Yoonia sp. BS5-3]|uniref:histidine kinase n=1 Tax=Yoonia phaeophyticola TaxID=3137369 RepID=A0ABZ2V549_9RHOB